MKHLLRATALLWLLLVAPAAAAPTVQEFPLATAGSHPQDLVLGPDGNIWFAERGNNMIGRISASNPGTIDEFPTVGTGPDITTVGPDGAIWYTEQSSKTVGRIAPGASPSAVGFILPELDDPRGIAVGPDGNLWVTDAGGATPQVLRLAPSGTPVGSGSIDLPVGFGPRNITKGPDNNMWVAGFGLSKIARITTSGAPTVDPPNGYDAPDGVTPVDIIAGNDGNLWYTAQGTTVGRITPAGVATNFTTQGVDPFGITIGPDGAVWFAEFQADAVGRVDAGGITTHITGLAAAAGPRYVTGGPGDTLWFTEDNGNRVGRISGIPLPQPQPQPEPQPQPIPTDTTRPDVTGLRLTRRVFRLGGLGTLIRFTLSEDARVTIRFARRVGDRWRRVRRVMRFQATSGSNRLRFRGRFDLRHPLRPGLYRMTLTARDAAGNVSTPDRARFRLLPRR